MPSPGNTEGCRTTTLFFFLFLTHFYMVWNIQKPKELPFYVKELKTMEIDHYLMTLNFTHENMTSLVPALMFAFISFFYG